MVLSEISRGFGHDVQSRKWITIIRNMAKSIKFFPFVQKKLEKSLKTCYSWCSFDKITSYLCPGVRSTSISCVKVVLMVEPKSLEIVMTQTLKDPLRNTPLPSKNVTCLQTHPYFLFIIHRTRLPGFSDCSMERLKNVDDFCLYNNELTYQVHKIMMSVYYVFRFLLPKGIVVKHI